jgi:hypothetical protein
MHMADEQDAFSIPEFCRRNGFGPGLYFKIARDGRGPRVMRVGRRTLISREAAEEWRREREAASAPRIPEAV